MQLPIVKLPAGMRAMPPGAVSTVSPALLLSTEPLWLLTRTR
jgi:hypothetical protein